jgi:hypothetical protein
MLKEMSFAHQAKMNDCSMQSRHTTSQSFSPEAQPVNTEEEEEEIQYIVCQFVQEL